MLLLCTYVDASDYQVALATLTDNVRAKIIRAKILPDGRLGRGRRCMRGRSPSLTRNKQACLLLSVEIDLERVGRFAGQSAGKLLVDRGPTNRKCRAFALESAHKTVENYRVYVLPNRRSKCTR